MPERHVDHLLIGGGIACASAATTLRKEGADGSVLLVGRELDAPYHRPPATKEYLRGEQSRDDVLIHPAAWYAEHDVELLTRTSVMSLDPAARTATLSTKEELSFGQALVATGSTVRRLDVEGAQHDGIHYVRALGNADAVRADAEGRATAVVVGGSYLACEVAASLTVLGLQVTMVMIEAEPHERGFGLRVGRWVRSVLEDHGVTLVRSDEVARFANVGDRISGVVTGGERELPADLVVAGVGGAPDVMLARRAGLELGAAGGIRCDERLRTTVSRDVLAAGDVCEYASVVHGGPIRVEHEVHAESQGAFAARTMLGADEPYREVPYFFSDIADWISFEYVGPAHGWDREVVRGSIDDGEFSVFYLADGAVKGALSVGRSGDLDAARELIASGEAIGEEGVRAL
jgi:3-phenylpropionate/trans-cinnamate dioxygenase ferredoxin reductase subunit